MPNAKDTRPIPEASDPVEMLRDITETLDAAPDCPDGGPDATQFLTALSLLRQLRGHIADWEPQLISAARNLGVSWADLAPALGVASRQAAERRYLRLRPSTDPDATTGDQRVTAERDRRAADRATSQWARDNAAELRELAGQISGLQGLPSSAETVIARLRAALGSNDAADLLSPLADTHQHLAANHPALGTRVEAVTNHTEALRRDSQVRRHPTT